LSFAALVFIAGGAAAALRADPSLVLSALGLVGCTAAICGVALDRRMRRARSQALRDALTGLPNRVLLEDRIQQALRASQRSGEPFTLICVDLDGFKEVNDVRGHSAGDAVLRSLARRFGATSKPRPSSGASGTRSGGRSGSRGRRSRSTAASGGRCSRTTAPRPTS
jgi:Diguanylate cyclase, GGDEF domain